MDSLTQIVLGSSVAALAAPARHRRAALAAGAVLGTLPDLDVLWFRLAGSDAITEVTWHRGPSHSLLVLGVFGWLLWLLLKPHSQRIQQAPRRWLWAIWLALLTHPLLDAFTVYGTQLLWPLPGRPVMWGTVFIIDPLYTLPLLVGVLAAWWLAPRELAALPPGHGFPPPASPSRAPAQRWLWAGVLLSSAYLVWSVAAKLWVDQVAARSLATQGLQHAPRFSTPLAFNTLLWRVTVMAPDGYWIGDRSLIADRGPMRFRFHPSNSQALAELAHTPQLQRLQWFTHGFLAAHAQPLDANRAEPAETDRQKLVVADLRMGLEPDYIFRYVLAHTGPDGRWQSLSHVALLPWSSDHATALSWVWRRLRDSEAQEIARWREVARQRGIQVE